MHIPDNYLSPQTCIVMSMVMVPVWAVAIKKVKAEITPKRFPLLGVMAAFSFLVMMFNVPLPGGTTGHAVGATLIAILLGPFAATLSITSALLIQALFFGDGGILAFAANCFNMAFVMPWTGYFFYKLISKAVRKDSEKYVAAFLASYIGINIAAFCAAVEFGIQCFFFKDVTGMPYYCPYPLAVSIPAMLVPHLLVAGIIEAIITAGVYAYVNKRSPEIIYADQSKKISLKPFYILIGIMILLVPLGLLVSGTAWGEWTKDEIKQIIGYVPQGMEKGFTYKPLFPDYNVLAFKNSIIGYLISGLFGAGLLLILSRVLTPFFKNKYSQIKEADK